MIQYQISPVSNSHVHVSPDWQSQALVSAANPAKHVTITLTMLPDMLPCLPGSIHDVQPEL
jgi:hypothetical protein